MTDAYQTAATALEAIDLPAYEARLQALFDERERIERTIEITDLKIRAKAAEVESAKRRGPDGRAAADALLADGDISSVAGRSNLLESELASLRAGRKELSLRATMITNEIGRLREELAQKLAAALEPIVAKLRADAETAAAILLSSHAGFKAVTSATNHRAAKVLGERLAEPLNALAGSSYTEGFCKRAPISVPDVLLALLEPLAPAVAFAHGRITNEVAFPNG